MRKICINLFPENVSSSDAFVFFLSVLLGELSVQNLRAYFDGSACLQRCSSVCYKEKR